MVSTTTSSNALLTKNTSRLIAVNAVSLGIAIIANLALLFNMARRLPFAIAQPITIIGWYISSFILIGLIAATPNHLTLPASEDRALGQAFYYAIMSASLYFIVASLMCFTVFGVYRDKIPEKFELTTSQRTLMLQTIAYLVYLMVGAAVFAHVESWTYLDTVYWANYTLLTVGTGDYSPTTHTGRGLLFPFSIFGIVILGLVIGSIRSLVLERGKIKLGARLVEKQREKAVRNMKTKGEKVKITPLSKPYNMASDGKTEKERRESEFNLMRKLQAHTATRRKWTSLLTSGCAWFTLWFIGALVFYKAERNQNWSYFESLYFSYVSLLTIGYGDFQPDSNSGKPFFVFWSLLAVPTLTILISNMGDTVIKGIKDITNYLGEFTILPGEGGTRARIKKGARKIIKGSKREDVEFDEPPGLMGPPHQDYDEEKQVGPEGVGTDRLAQAVERDELGQEKEAKDRGDEIGKEIHHYHYLLVREIRKVQKDVNNSPLKKYTYNEWAWFLRLMGEDENSAKSHRKPHVKLQDGEGMVIQQAGINDDPDGETPQWSWLGLRSPLLGETEEAEWVLERLSETLEKELKKQRDEQRRASSGSGQPRIESPEKTPLGKLSSSHGSSNTLEEGVVGRGSKE